MQALTLPAARGWQWLREAYRLFGRQPALIGMLVMFYWLALILLNVLPLVGPLVAALAMPGFSVGVLTACRAVDRRLPVGPGVFLAPLRQRPRPLVLLGAVYFAYTLAALGIASLVDGGTLLEAALHGQPLDEAAMEDGRFLLAAQVLLLVMAPILMAYWYAPMLVVWHRLPVLKALVFSFIACLRNWRAFLVYGLALIVCGGLLPGIVVGVVSALLPPLAGFVSSLITLPLLMILGPTVFASFYVSYREVFVVPESISEHA
jgi:hypothetical protein